MPQRSNTSPETHPPLSQAGQSEYCAKTPIPFSLKKNNPAPKEGIALADRPGARGSGCIV
jgi:hypothetical protein